MKKRYSLLTAMALTVSVTFAQQYEGQSHLTATIVNGTTADFKAIDRLTASNHVESKTTIRYVASQSVTLQPGFVVETGATFTAAVEPVQSLSRLVEGDSKLKVTVYPNPFADVVSVGYELPVATAVKQTLTDVQGQVISQIGGSEMERAGTHQITIKGDGMQTGVYYLRLQTATEQRVIRLLKK